MDIPTTIITTYIETNNPTTITTTYIETDTPTTITTTYTETNTPTTIIITYTETNAPTTIITTYVETDIPTTITTTYTETDTQTTNIPIKENYLGDEKCKTSTEESARYKLCTSCNDDLQYYPAFFPDNTFLHGFIECYNNNSKPINFYFNDIENIYKPCYETCLTCKEGGNSDNNNCLTCDINYIKKPEYQDSTNCVTECYYLYYYSIYGQYKCTNNSNCPEEAYLYIKDLKKCTNDCKKEIGYEFQYSGQCLKNCPEKTTPNEKNICIDDNLDSCSRSDTEINIQEFLTSGGVDYNAKLYAKEFQYTTKHITHYYNNFYSIILYKDKACIDELSIDMQKIDFRECYTKVKNSLKPPSDDKIIIGLIERFNGNKKSSNHFSFYHPITGEKLDIDKICTDEEVIIKESVLSQLNNTELNLSSLLYLTKQDINIFNLSDAFYTDICYPFDSPNGKDVPLQDRIKTYYPNITLCETGCTSKGVNLTSMESICECKFNILINNELIEGNALVQNTLGEVKELLNSSNLLVLKCFNNVFIKKNIIKGTGGFIILSILLLEIIFGLIFLLYDMAIIRKYVYNLTEYFMAYIINLNKGPINSNQENKKINPPKKGGTKVTKTPQRSKSIKNLSPKKKRKTSKNFKSLK